MDALESITVIVEKPALTNRKIEVGSFTILFGEGKNAAKLKVIGIVNSCFNEEMKE